ncbi:MAG: Gfo/Idh/MocA family oxidoreductase [Sphingobacteriales bacterium]|nr:Gfo/Idh/MocA family oxidoreductase [Sphingobacteriales bacterium]
MTGGFIKAGICSFGMSGKLFHAPFLHAHPGYELSAIVERHKQDSRERYPNAKLYRSVEDLCADPDLDLIVVNTPTYLHYEQALLVLQSGKNLVLEKPFAVTAKQAETITRLAEEEKRFISIYQNRRYDGDYRAVKEMVQSGWLGELREAEFRYDRFRPAPGGKQHKEGDLPGAGILFDLSPHLVDQAIQLFGFPKAVFADSWRMRPDVIANDYFEILLYYDRLRVRLKATCIAREPVFAYTLHGMKGSFLQQRSDMQEIKLQEGISPTLDSWCDGPSRPDGILHTEINGKLVRKETTSGPGNYMGYYDDVYKALTGVGPNPVPAADGIRNMKIIDAALESVREKKVVAL